MAPPRRGTSPASACRCWCCSASSGSCRTAPAPGRTSWRAPCANGKCGLAHAERRQRAVVGDAPQRQDGGQARHARRCGSPGTAGRWRSRPASACSRGGTQRTALVIMQSTSVEPVVGPRRVAAARKAEVEQRRVEQIAGEIAGERPPGAVGAPQARRQADDQQARVCRARRTAPRRCTRRARACRLAARKATRRGQSGQSRGASAGTLRHARSCVARRQAAAALSGGPRPRRRDSRASPARARRARGADGARVPGSRTGRVAGSRQIWSSRSARSMNWSACRRSSSATIGGWVCSVDTTLTRRPRICMAATRARKSPSPVNSTTWSRCSTRRMASTRQLDVHVALDLAPAERVGELLGRLGDHGVAVVVEPIDQRPDRGVFLVLGQRRVVERAHQLALAAEQRQQPLVVDVEAERLGGRVEVGAVNEERKALSRIKMHSSTLSAMPTPLKIVPRDRRRYREVVIDASDIGYHSRNAGKCKH